MVALSYDPPETLAAFAKKKSITFPLLSDEGSATIRAYGLENEDLGIPHPGTLVLDADGIIRAKLFLDGFRKRHDPEELLEVATVLSPRPG